MARSMECSVGKPSASTAGAYNDRRYARHWRLGALAAALIGLSAAVLTTSAGAYSEYELDVIAQHLWRGSVEAGQSCGTDCQALWEKEQGAEADGDLAMEFLELRQELGLMPSLSDLKLVYLRPDREWVWMVMKRGAPAGEQHYKLVHVEAPAAPTTGGACQGENCGQHMRFVEEGVNLNAGGHGTVPAPADGYLWYWKGVESTWRRLVPGGETHCNDHPPVPDAFEVYTSGQSTWCYSSYQQQVGFFPLADLKLTGPTTEPEDYSDPGHDLVEPFDARGWSDAAFRAAVQTELASGKYPMVEAFYEFQNGVVPYCRGLTVPECGGLLDSAGFPNHQVTQATGSEIDFAVGSGLVAGTSPDPGAEAARDEEITIIANPGTGAMGDELAKRYAPRLIYEADEAFRADSAELLTDWHENSLVRQSGPEIPAAQLSIDDLAPDTYPDGLLVSADDFVGRAYSQLEVTYNQIAAETQRWSDPARYQDKTYARVVPSAAATWVQYWLFYYYNPVPPGPVARAFGVGAHQGDWELVQLRFSGTLADGLTGIPGPLGIQPATATAAVHESGERCPWVGVGQTADGRPRFFVAQDSHASFFGRGGFNYSGIPGAGDTVKGDGPYADVAPISVSHAPPWIRWTGDWGATRPGTIPTSFNEVFGIRSPKGPGSETRGDSQKWTDPGSWEAGLSSGDAGCGGDNGPAPSELEDGLPAASSRESDADAPITAEEIALKVVGGSQPGLLELEYKLSASTAASLENLRFAVHREDLAGTPGVGFSSPDLLGRGALTVAEPAGSGPLTVVIKPFGEQLDRTGETVLKPGEFEVSGTD